MDWLSSVFWFNLRSTQNVPSV